MLKFQITADVDGNIELEGTDDGEPLTVVEHVPGLFIVNSGEPYDWEDTIVVSFKTDGGALMMDVMIHDIYKYTRVMHYRTGWEADCPVPSMFALALENFANR
jgi:hypothetical protein